MPKVVLEVEKKNLDTLMTILENLKDGLISSIEVEKKRSYNKPKPMQKEELKPVNLSNKYVDPKTFKERLKKMRQKSF